MYRQGCEIVGKKIKAGELQSPIRLNIGEILFNFFG